MRREPQEYGEDDDRGASPTRGLKPLLVTVLVGLAVLVGGAGFLLYRQLSGETTATVIERYRPRFAERRASLKKIAEKLPPSGSVQGETWPARLEPKPMYDVQRKVFNTAILMVGHCSDPDWNPKTPGEFDLGFHEDEYNTHLRWTGDRSPMVESARKAPARDLPERLERSLALEYLVVARPVRYEPPRVVNPDTFTGCELDLEVFLVELRSEKLIGSFRRSFRPDAQVMVTFTKDRKENESAEAFVYSNMWSKARAEVAATLARGTGGVFVIDRNR